MSFYHQPLHNNHKSTNVLNHNGNSARIATHTQKHSSMRATNLFRQKKNLTSTLFV